MAWIVGTQHVASHRALRLLQVPRDTCRTLSRRHRRPNGPVEATATQYVTTSAPVSDDVLALSLAHPNR